MDGNGGVSKGERSRSSQWSRRAAQEPRGGNEVSVGSPAISAGGGRRRDQWHCLEAHLLESVGGGDQREEAEPLDSLAGRNDSSGCGGSGRWGRPCSVAARERTEEGRALEGGRGEVKWVKGGCVASGEASSASRRAGGGLTRAHARRAHALLPTGRRLKTVATAVGWASWSRARWASRR